MHSQPTFITLFALRCWQSRQLYSSRREWCRRRSNEKVNVLKIVCREYSYFSLLFGFERSAVIVAVCGQNVEQSAAEWNSE